MASCESTGGKLSFEWSHHRISSIDSKVRVTLQNPIKHSGSERVNRNFFSLGFFPGIVSDFIWCPTHKCTTESRLSYFKKKLFYNFKELRASMHLSLTS